ncbi:ABC-three component system middle component 6 [Acinetobacter baumannii]|uniref:ABC-three component system middle component 6 n=1 Tax=Acinetobacter baumannii TaxID=470 RepID=UPI0021C89CEE|nr:ABC-three component system middle component 6 [Acinetobacter baumannii]EHU1483712.1 hypothetical protein [Acinetobacter baumannii]EHU2704082.1 hypothetical protein [Acinetobacter baumannii]
MIPKSGADPNINIIVIGGFLLNEIQNKKSINIDKLIYLAIEELDLSIDHIILSLDWLFIIKAITLNLETQEIQLNEIQ